MSSMIGCLSLLLLGLSSQAKQPAPDFVGASKDWIQGQTSLERLRGKVVMVDFWDYTCVNCIRTFPYLREWYRRYHPLGFEIVAIHTPEFEFEEDPANVRTAAKRFGFTFPVLNDPKQANWNRYNVESWPTKVLLDASGVPVWSHVGEGDYQNMESRIQAEIKKRRPEAKLPPVMGYLYDVHRPGAVCYPCTHEIFAGVMGAREKRVGYDPSLLGRDTDFSLPREPKKNILYLEGKWRPKNDRAISLEPATGAYLQYAAKEVNSVMKSPEPVLVEIYQDGKPLAKEDLGSDVKLVSGRALARIREPRMYSLVKNAKWGRRELRLRFQGKGLRLFTFSFSTDCMYLPKGAKRT